MALSAGTSRSMRVEEADELLMAVALHVLADDRAVEHVERGEERRRAVPFVIMGHGAGAALLHRQAGLGAVERLDLRLLIDRQHHGMGRRIDIEPDDIEQLICERRIVGELEMPPAVRARPWAFQIACTVEAAMPAAFAIARNVQWVASYGGGSSVRRTISATRAGAIGALPGGRVLSRKRPSTPSCMNRSCQRQTQVFDLPVSAMIAEVPRPSALRRTIRARQTCFCGALGSATIASNRWRSRDEIVKEMPLRMPQTRTRTQRKGIPIRTSLQISPID